MAGGTIEMIQTGKKGVELRNILAQRVILYFFYDLCWIVTVHKLLVGNAH